MKFSVILNWGDIRRITVAMLLVIAPTMFLGTYTTPALQSYQVTGPGLWDLKRVYVPDGVIEPLHVLRLKPYFFKSKLMDDIQIQINNPELYNQYEKKIEKKLQVIPMPWVEYIFMAILAVYYWLLWYFTRNIFPDGQV